MVCVISNEVKWDTSFLSIPNIIFSCIIIVGNKRLENSVVFVFVPNPTFRFSPCSQSFFSFAIASASFGRIALPRKNNFQNCGAATTIWGKHLT